MQTADVYNTLVKAHHFTLQKGHVCNGISITFSLIFEIACSPSFLVHQFPFHRFNKFSPVGHAQLCVRTTVPPHYICYGLCVLKHTRKDLSSYLFVNFYELQLALIPLYAIADTVK